MKTTILSKENVGAEIDLANLSDVQEEERVYQPCHTAAQNCCCNAKNNSFRKSEPFFSDTVFISESVHDSIKRTVGARRPETGMVLGSSDGKVIDFCYFDESAVTSGATYSPNVDFINNTVIPDWYAKGVKLVGFVHSHPGGGTPSLGDAIYARALLPAIQDLKVLALPIVRSSTSGSFEMRFFVARIDIAGNAVITPCDYKIVPAAAATKQSNSIAHETWSRINKVFPYEVMRRKAVVIIGCGGASEYAESLARCGVGRIVLFDGDVYEAPNIATQQTYIDDLGKNKAEALKERVLRINPACEVVAVPKHLDDMITDSQFAEIIGIGLQGSRSEDVLITGCTDSFFAQARAARLAMKYGCPYMAAQLYKEGAGAEVLFTYPGVTDSCPRCILHRRYTQFLHNGYKNTVGSHQAPIFATQRVNALKGHISAMLLLYKESKGSRYCDELDWVANRNIALVRMSNQLEMPFFDNTFLEIPQAFYDETLWIETTPGDGKDGHISCPDCEGKGLMALKGRIEDTRILLVDAGVNYQHPGKSVCEATDSSEAPVAVASAMADTVAINNAEEAITVKSLQKSARRPLVSLLKRYPYGFGVAACFLIVFIGACAALAISSNSPDTNDSVSLSDSITPSPSSSNDIGSKNDQLSSNPTLSNLTPLSTHAISSHRAEDGKNGEVQQSQSMVQWRAVWMAGK